jgi:hypothetical protein
VTFPECVAFCATQPGWLAQIDRLRGTNFSRWGRRLTPIERMIDEATGNAPGNTPTEEEMALFAVIVYDLVWTRIKREGTP